MEDATALLIQAYMQRPKFLGHKPGRLTPAELPATETTDCYIKTQARANWGNQAAFLEHTKEVDRPQNESRVLENEYQSVRQKYD